MLGKKIKFFILLAFLLLANYNIYALKRLVHNEQKILPTPKKIIFLNIGLGSWQGAIKGIIPFYEEMKKDGHDVKIASVGVDFDNQIPEEDIIYPCGKSAPYKCTSLAQYNADYIITSNPYCVDNAAIGIEGESYLGLKGLKNTGSKIIYITYGPGIFYQSFLYIPKLADYVDIALVDSESTKKLFEKEFGFYKNKNRVVVAGYQTYSEIRNQLQPRDHKKKETILWMPRWYLFFCGRDCYEGGSTFLNYYHFFYNYALSNSNVNFIIRPHKNMYSVAIANQFLTKEQFDEIFNKFKLLPNVKVSTHGIDSLVDDILESDIVIADGTSALAEAVVADKPIIYLSNGYNHEFDSNDLSKQFKDHVQLAYAPANYFEKNVISYIEALRKDNYKATYSEQFKRMLDPVDNPAKFISNYLLNLPKKEK